MGRTKNSKRWSEKDLKLVHKMMLEGAEKGLTKYQAKQEVGKHFGVTALAIDVRYNRWLKGMKGTSKNTNKVPVKRKYGKRGKYNKKAKTAVKETPVVKTRAKRSDPESSNLLFSLGLLNAHKPQIKDITINFDARTITYTF